MPSDPSAMPNDPVADGPQPRRFYVLVGIPGSGKSTYARLFLRGALRVSLDDIRLMLSGRSFVGRLEPIVVEVGTASTEAVAGYAAARGYDVVFDATSVTPQRRKPLIALARRFGLSPVAVYVEAPLEIALQRNRDRPEPVPAGIITSFCQRLVPPSLTEGFDEVITVNAAAPGAEHDHVVRVERAGDRRSET